MPGCLPTRWHVCENSVLGGLVRPRRSVADTIPACSRDGAAMLGEDIEPIPKAQVPRTHCSTLCWRSKHWRRWSSPGPCQGGRQMGWEQARLEAISGETCRRSRARAIPCRLRARCSRALREPHADHLPTQRSLPDRPRAPLMPDSSRFPVYRSPTIEITNLWIFLRVYSWLVDPGFAVYIYIFSSRPAPVAAFRAARICGPPFPCPRPLRQVYCSGGVIPWVEEGWGGGKGFAVDARLDGREAGDRCRG